MKEIFLAVADLPEDRRRDRAHTLARGDALLTERLDSLLDADRSNGTIPEVPPRMESDGGLAADPADPSSLDGGPPPVIPGFTLLELIGVGSFGLVYLAEQQSPRRLVAIKVLRPGPATAGVIRRFRREAELLARLRHPAIAQVFGAGTIAHPDGRPYIILEHVSGGPITSRLADSKLETSHRLRLLADLADAVHHAHAQGVLHRDLKPINVFLDEQGQVRVLDFGVARLLDAGPGTESIDSDSRLFGTVATMSPEALGLLDHPVDTRSDVYSLGIIAHEVLAGHPPFGTDPARAANARSSLGDLLDRIRTGNAVPLPEAIPRDAAAVVCKAAAPRPADRYQSAAEFAEELRLAAAGRPVRARTPTAIESAARFIKRHPRSALAIFGAAALAAAGVAAIAAARHRAAHNADLAIAAADVVLHEALDHLGPLSGTIAERESIVARLEQTLPQLAAARTNDPRLGVANARLLAARAGLEFEHLRHDRSLVLRLAALDQLDRAMGSGGYEPRADDLRLRSMLLVHIGDAERKQGDTIAALKCYERALAADDARVAASPDDRASRSDRLWSHQRLAKAYLDQDRTRSIQHLRAQDADAVALLRIAPDHPSTLHAALQTIDDAKAYPMNTSVEQELGENAALTLARRLLIASPTNRGHRALAAGTLLSVAVELSALGNHTQALAIWTEAAGHQRTLESIDPKAESVMRGTAHLAGIGAQLAEDRREFAAAAGLRADATNAWRRVVAAAPDRPEPVMALASATAWHGFALLRDGRESEAHDALLEAIDLVASVLALHPDTPDHLLNMLDALVCAHQRDPAPKTTPQPLPDAWLARLIPTTLPHRTASDLRTAIEALAQDLSDNPAPANLASAAESVAETLPRLAALLTTRHGLRQCTADASAAMAPAAP